MRFVKIILVSSVVVVLMGATSFTDGGAPVPPNPPSLTADGGAPVPPNPPKIVLA